GENSTVLRKRALELALESDDPQLVNTVLRSALNSNKPALVSKALPRALASEQIGVVGKALEAIFSSAKSFKMRSAKYNGDESTEDILTLSKIKVSGEGDTVSAVF